MKKSLTLFLSLTVASAANADIWHLANARPRKAAELAVIYPGLAVVETIGLAQNIENQ